MSALRLLALSYLAAASLFVMAAMLIAHPQTTRGISALFIDHVWHPTIGQDGPLPDNLDNMPVARLTLEPPGPNDVRTLARPHVMPPLVRAVAASDDRLKDPQFAASASVTILPDLSPESAPVPEPKFAIPEMPQAVLPEIRIARAAPDFRIPDPPGFAQAPQMTPDAPPKNSLQAVSLRLKASLTPEMLRNFDLFLYVSKAGRGPLAQRMYVFRKTASGEISLLYDWAASTGREQNEITPRGRSTFTATPKGFYQFDPDRLYRRYHSHSWDQDMPNAMFFNWERQGLETGLAIHSATGGDIARLGRRASAGCVHLSPENAATLFNLIKADYRGQVPRFAYNAETETMSNTGDFAHRRDGSLKMTDGYKVLVDIEDYGGADIVAALN